MSARHQGSDKGEELTGIRDASNWNPMIVESAGEPTQTILSDGSQIHVWGEEGDDTIHIGFQDITSYTKGHHVRGDQKRFSNGLFEDTFVFRDLDKITNGAIVVGRIEDYDASRDTILIEGTAPDLAAGAGTTAGYDWKVVNFDVDRTDSAQSDQQWLLIDTGDGYLFYTLEGARVPSDGDGARNGQEPHFARYESVSGDSFNGDLWNLAPTGYVDPVNHVPAGYGTPEGVVINDYDDGPADLAVLEGTDLGDHIAAGLNDDVVHARAGDDIVWGGSGNDTVEGGAGDDSLYGGPGNDSLSGQEGNDLIFGGNGADTLNGGAGDDTIIGGDTEADLSDTVYAGSGNDSVDGGYGNDVLHGMDGNDTIKGGQGADYIVGGAGDDVLSGGAGSDRIFGGDGFDFINGGFGSDRLNGGAGADKFFHAGSAGHGSDWIQDYSAAEGDLLVFGAAADAADFQVNLSNTAGAGDVGTDEAFVIHKPTGQILWALVDGAAQDEIRVSLDGETFDLLA